MLDLDALLAPLAGADPCGVDLSFTPELDAIAEARRADDPTLEQGAWVTALKEADWKLVTRRCAVLIQERSKDLQLAVWLAEAAAHTGGLRGLADGLLLVAGLCERYWDGLHPLPDEGSQERRIGNLHWIAARAPELILGVPVAESGLTMREVEAARARGGEGIDALDAARRKGARGWYAAVLDDAAHCAAALDGLEQIVDARLGQEGPSFGAARAALQGLMDFVTPAAREAGAMPPARTAPAEPGGAPAVPDAPLASPPAFGPVLHRAQALAQLRMVAEFFRRTEPHSPVAYLADKAANWGEQPLHLWLRAVLKEDAALARLEELLGVPPG